MINRRLFICAAAVGLSPAPAAWANGGEFYEVHDDPTQKVTLAFSGRVKDPKGTYIEDAEIVINVPEPFLTYSIRTDSLGHFKSTDIGREIVDIVGSNDIDPTQIEIKVVKAGYKQIYPKVTAAPKKFGRVPIDFILTPSA